MALPFLFDQHDLRDGDRVGAGLDLDASVMTLALRGPWSSHLHRAMSTAAEECLSAHPATLIIDLLDLADPDAVSAPVWLALRSRADAMEPAVQVLLCIPSGTALARRVHRLGSYWYLPVHPTMGLARAAAAERMPLTGRHHLELEPDENAAVVARSVLTDACTAWRLTRLRDRGRLVVSELVANTIEHAGTALDVVLSRRGNGLHIAVRDGDVRMPQLLDLPGDRPAGEGIGRRGYGLHTVQTAVTSWGAIPTEGGKVVWALIRPWSRPE